MDIKNNLKNIKNKISNIKNIKNNLKNIKNKISNTKNDFKNKLAETKYLKGVIKKEVNFIPVDKLVAPKHKGRKVLAEVKNLHLGFKDSAQPNKINKIIRGASFKLHESEILAIIGESGSGKSVISSSLFGMIGENVVIESGQVKLLNQEVQSFNEKTWDKSKYRGSIISAIFQNPMTTLNPTMKIKHQIMEGLLLNKHAKTKREAYELALSFLEQTRIINPKKVMDMYPHELSGGMKQRVVISSIIACRPKIIVMDEPTTALDPSVQAEILDIIRELVHTYNISVIFITHDLGVVASIADRIAIMYAGQMLEVGTTREVLYNPQHPYAWGLLMSMPDLNKSEKLRTIKGAVPSNLNNLKGEAFAPRNDWSMGIDFLQEAPYFKISDTHFVKSWLLHENAPKHEPPQLIKERWKKFKEQGNNVNIGKGGKNG